MKDEPLLTVDALGKRCPAPVIALARRISEIGIGTVLAVLSDDAATRLDVPAWCRMQGHEYLGEEPLTDRSGTAYLVRRLR